MKFRLIVKLGEYLLGKRISDDEPRADMYLPVKILSLALVLLLGGIAAAIIALAKGAAGFAIIAITCIPLGIAALLCWWNQTIHIVSDESFVYTTFMGNRREYRFEDIVGLRRNRDSMTLLIGGDKVHIESLAILSERLVERINEQLQKAAYIQE